MAETLIVDETLDEGRDFGSGDGKPRMSPEKKRKLLIIGLTSLTTVSLISGGGAVLYVVMLGGGGGGAIEVNVDTSALRAPGPEDLPIYHEFPEQMVDIKSTSRRTRYVRIRMLAEVYFPENKDRLEAIEPQILDGMQTYLRSKTPKELAGRDGTEAMRDAFMQIARDAMGPRHKINTILFKEILVQ